MILDQIDALRITMLPRGVCYYGAYTMLRLSPMRASDSVKLCHGVAILTDGTEREFGHAWIEETDSNGAAHCYDYRYPANPVPQSLFYEVGRVKLDTVKRYSWFKAKRLSTSQRHFGPWDDTIFKAAHK